MATVRIDGITFTGSKKSIELVKKAAKLKRTSAKERYDWPDDLALLRGVHARMEKLGR